ncbi:MAG: TetR family transcriptional regulator [Ectothiorhodospiraceae bacterium]|nr:TetR family transcriptional regulator [Ectothiorhodospiraceae bacterium]
MNQLNKKKQQIQRKSSVPRRSVSETQNLILDAAEEIVLELGGRELKLDLAAKVAKLSKGGVLYHFPTKAKLIEAMLARLLKRYDSELQAMSRDDSATERLSSYIRSSFHTGKRDKRMSAALLAVIAEDKTLLEPLRDFYKQRFGELRKTELNFNNAAIAMLAVEGLFFLDLLELSYLKKKERNSLEKKLLLLINSKSNVCEID